MTAAPFPLKPALWYATAVPAPPTPPLDEAAETEVAVVGAGYAGLSTALHLARKGISVTVLEAHEPGWGGSGRNGGQVNPGLKYDPDELEQKFGQQAGAALAAFMGNAAANVFRLIDEYEMAVPHARNGWIVAAHNKAGFDTVVARAEQWRRRGVAAQTLDKEAIAEHLGTAAYIGGWLDPRGGSLQPLSYTRELCRAALEEGARICGGTPVSRIEKDGAGWRLVTASGAAVTAKKVALCTNAYTRDLWPGLRQTIIAANSLQVATAPLSDNLRKSILPHGQHCSDTRKLLHYFRLDHEGRFLIGGRGPFREPEGKEDWAQLERSMVGLYPQLEGVPVEFRWGGRVSITQDWLPHLHEPEPGLIVNIGCQGRGVGLETTMGIALADYCATGRRETLPFPVTPVKAIPFHALQQLYVAAMVTWYRVSDAGLA